MSPALTEDLDSGGALGDEEGGDGEARGGKRGVLPRSATQAMRAWLFQHLVVRRYLLCLVPTNKIHRF